jgi:hypothetical protein
MPGAGDKPAAIGPRSSWLPKCGAYCGGNPKWRKGQYFAGVPRAVEDFSLPRATKEVDEYATNGGEDFPLAMIRTRRVDHKLTRQASLPILLALNRNC